MMRGGELQSEDGLFQIKGGHCSRKCQPEEKVTAKRTPLATLSTGVTDFLGNEGLMLGDPWCSGWELGVVHGALGPLEVPGVPPLLDFGSKLSNLKIAPRREAGRPRVSPWPRRADFAWNLLPSEQRLHPIPALSEQSQESWVTGVLVGDPNGATANPVSCRDKSQAAR